MEAAFKEPDDLSASIGEDALMDLEDMATQMICGKNVHEYSEFELQSLDIGALTEYETLLYAQALSRMEYAKESEARGRGGAAAVMTDNSRCQQMREADEFMYEQELLDEAELMFYKERAAPSTSMTTTRHHGNRGMVEVSSSPMKRGEEENGAVWQYRDESESGSLSTKLSSNVTTESTSGGSEWSDSYGSNQKVPDISEAAENMDSTGLFCEENLSEDGVVELRGLKVLSDDFQSSGKSDPSKSSALASDRCLFCGQILMGCDCVHCTTGAKDFGVDSLDESGSTESSKSVDVISAKEDEGVRDVFVSPGILSDKKNQPKVAAAFTKEESDNLQISAKKPPVAKDHQESPKPQQQKTTYLSKTNSNSAAKAKTSLPPCSSPSPQKVPLDVFMVSPSKNRNLVKTRDYSRLRSPSASPKKKLAKASPLKKGSASKQLMFPEETTKSRQVFLNSAPSLKDGTQCHQQHTPQKSTPRTSTTGSASAGSTHIAPSWSQNKQSKNVSFGLDRKDVMASRALQFGEEDELDSMDTSKVTSEESSRILAFPLPSSPFHAINTSTPVTASSHGNACNANNNTPSAHQGPLLSNPGPSSCSSSNHNAKSSTTASTSTSKTLNRDASSDAENSPDNENPLRDCQSQRRKAGRCLANSFSAADKENSIVVSQAKQARGKRISQIEQGEAGCSYRLVGIVNHHGESLFAGHYTCSTYNLSKQQWYHMDDKHTQETTESAVRRDSSSTGYVFFYMDKELYESYASRKSSSSTSSS